jgi:hypothetical protein
MLRASPGAMLPFKMIHNLFETFVFKTILVNDSEIFVEIVLYYLKYH